MKSIIALAVLLLLTATISMTVRVNKRFTVPYPPAGCGAWTTIVGGPIIRVGSNGQGTRYKALAVGLAGVTQVAAPDNPCERVSYAITITP